MEPKDKPSFLHVCSSNPCLSIVILINCRRF
jgi:hypothetical protein